MSVGDLTNSIIAGLNDGLEGFLEGTIVAVLPVIWLAILGLHVGRPYILDMIDRFTLRLGADLLWVIYILVRDLLIISGFIMSFMFFFPDVLTGNQMPLTGGLAAVALLGVMLVKLMGDPDNNVRDFRLTSYLLGIGALLYFVPYIFGVQFNSVATGSLKTISDFLVSSSNTGWSVVIAYVSLALVGIGGIVAVVYVLGTGGRPESEEPAVSEQKGSAMTPDDISNAITGAIGQGGQTWLVATLVAFLPTLWTMTLILHLGRPYVLRNLRRMGLRLGADIWWMTYLLLRDAVMLVTLGVSLIFFQPNLVANSDLPITGPLTALFLLLALVVKLSRRADDDVAAYRLTTVFLVIGATLYYIPLVFAIEGADQSYLAKFAEWFTSSANSNLALGIMWVSLVGVVIVAAWLFLRALNAGTRAMQRRLPGE